VRVFFYYLYSGMVERHGAVSAHIDTDAAEGQTGAVVAQSELYNAAASKKNVVDQEFKAAQAEQQESDQESKVPAYLSKNRTHFKTHQKHVVIAIKSTTTW